MPLILSHPLVKEFTLDKTDEKYGVTDEPTTVKIRQATMREKGIRDDLYKKMESTYSDAGVVVKQDVSGYSVLRKEVFLTLADCNILSEDGKTQLFSFKDDHVTNEVEFNTAWGQLLPDMANEIVEKMLIVNPMWNFSLGEAVSEPD